MNEPTRTGKIARCPPQIRDEVNRRLFEGQLARTILAWLNAQEDVLRILDEHFGEEPVSPQNLSEWRAGGYQDWLRRNERVQRIGAIATYAAKLGEAAGGNETDGSAALIGGRIFEKLEKAIDDGDDALIAALVDPVVKLRASNIDAKKSKQRDKTLNQRERVVSLAEKNYEIRFCEGFIRYAEDKRAIEIATGKAKTPIKIEQLRQLMFPQLTPLDPKAINEV